jgi:hypothetical protein
MNVLSLLALQSSRCSGQRGENCERHSPASQTEPTNQSLAVYLIAYLIAY